MSKVREISVERVHLGEASDEEVEEVFGDPAATARLEELAEEDETFHHTHPRNEQLGAIQRRLHLVETRERWARRKRWMGVSAVLLPVVAAVGDDFVVDAHGFQGRKQAFAGFDACHGLAHGEEVGDEVGAALFALLAGAVFDVLFLLGDQQQVLPVGSGGLATQ